MTPSWRRPAVLAGAALLVVVAVALPLHAARVRRDAALETVGAIAREPGSDAAQVAALRRRLQAVLAEQPDLPEAQLLAARLEAAARQLEDAARQHLLADTLDALDRSWRVHGGWPTEVAQLEATLAAAGCWPPPVGDAVVAGHPEAARLRRALAQLLRARGDARLSPDPRVAALLAVGAPPAWSALARVLGDPGQASEADCALALGDPASAESVLALLPPDPGLVAAAQGLLAADPGAFWPRVCLARDAVRRGDWAQARAHALVALGRESASLWPRLVLGRADLAAGDWPGLLVDATHAAAAAPANAEAVALQAIALAHLGRADEAAARLRSLPAGGTGWYREHPDLAAAALAAGLPADLTPAPAR